MNRINKNSINKFMETLLQVLWNVHAMASCVKNPNFDSTAEFKCAVLQFECAHTATRNYQAHNTNCEDEMHDCLVAARSFCARSFGKL